MTSDHIRPNRDVAVAPVSSSGMGHRILQAAAGSQFTALCKGRVGVAADGAKWSAVSLCTFRDVTPAADAAETQDRTFRFVVETTGQLSPAEALHSALQSLRSRVDPTL